MLTFRKLKFWKRDGGMAAVEFAFVLPVMMSFFLGLIEVSQGLTCRASVANLASTGADLIAQENSVSGTDMQNVFSALGAMLFPFSITPAQITISSLVDNNTSTTAKVAWSCTHGGTARTVNAPVTIPTGLITSGSGGSVILTEVSYSYTSPISTYFVGTVTMSNTFYAKPRKVAKIPLTSCT